MGTLSYPNAADACRTPDPAPVPPPLLVATRGDAASDGAIELAVAMGNASGARVRILAVVQPSPTVAPELTALVALDPTELDAKCVARAAVEAQLKRLAIPQRKVEIEIGTGDPPTIISRAARVAHAAMILLGADDHDLLERLFGGDTAVRVARAADVPVLVVPRGCSHVPESAVVAIDFSDASVRAGQVALRLFPDLTALHLVHVAPAPQPALELVASMHTRYAEAAERAFEAVREAMVPPAYTVVTRQIVRGNAARELLRAARERGVDLIVAGSHGHSAFERVLVGSVATALLRGARVPVLVLPAEAATHHGH